MSVNRCTLIAILVSMVVAPSSAQSWEWLNPTPTGNSITDVAVIDSDTYYFVSNGGDFLRTSDGGAFLTLESRIPTKAISSLAFISPDTGWVAGQDGNIGRTFDGGSSWELVYEDPDGAALRSIDFATAQTGWTAGDISFTNLALRKTTDAGATWDIVDVPPTPSAPFDGFFYVRATGPELVHAVSYANVHYRSEDGGVTWDSTHFGAVSVASFPEGAFFLDDNNGWVVGPNATILHTADGGQTWGKQLGSPDSTDFGTTYLTSVSFYDLENGWATSADCLYKTENGGENWSRSCGSTEPFRDFNMRLFGDDLGFVLDPGALLLSRDGGDTFENLLPGYKNTIRSAAFVSPETGWAVGDDVLYTTDGWRSFEVQPTDLVGTLTGVDAWSEEEAIGAGLDGRIIYTSNGGASWTEQTSGVSADLRALAILNDQSVIAAGDEQTVLRSDDQGTTWNVITTGLSENDINALSFLDDGQHGWAVGDTGFVAVTMDGGLTWQAQESGTLRDLRTVHFVDQNTGWAAGRSGTILATTDGGQTWVPQVSPNAFASYDDLFFLDTQRGWAVSRGSITQTTDGGATWSIDETNISSNSHFAVYFSDVASGWVFGGDGTILRLGGSATAIEAEVPRVHNRLAAYPNPARNRATIEFTLDVPGEVEFSVFDVLGRRIHLQREMFAVGGQQFYWTVSSYLASGLYLAEVKRVNGERLGTAPLTVIR